MTDPTKVEILSLAVKEFSRKLYCQLNEKQMMRETENMVEEFEASTASTSSGNMKEEEEWLEMLFDRNQRPM